MTTPLTDDSDLYWRTPLVDRLGPLVSCFVMAAIVVGVFTHRMPKAVETRHTLYLMMTVFLLGLAALAASLVSNLRSAYIFGLYGVTSREWSGSRTLAYSDMANCTVHEETIRGGARSGPTRYGMRVVFLPARPDVQPLSMFIDKRVPLDPRIITRLRGVPKLDPRALKVLDLAKARREW